MRGPTRLIALSVTAFVLVYLLYSTSASVKSPSLPQSWDETIHKYNPVEHFRQPAHPSLLAEPPVPQDAAAPLDPLAAPTATTDILAATAAPALQTQRSSIYEYIPSATSATDDLPIATGPDQTLDAPLADATAAPDFATSDYSALTQQQQQQVVKPVSKKALVLAKPWMVDGHWIKHELSSWDTTVYNITNSTAPINLESLPDFEQFPPKGGAALAFLTWIIENYDNLADVNFFISVIPVPKWGHQDAVLDIRNVAPTLHEVNVSYVAEYQYSSIRCDLDPGCASIADEVHPWLPNSDESRQWHKEVIGAWNAFTMNSGATVPDRIANPSGAQFAATRRQIRAQPRRQYESVRAWLAESNLDEDTLTLVMDSMYHIIMGRPALDCPDDRVCYCDFYGQSCLEDEDNTSPSNSLHGGRRKQHKKKWTPWSA